MWHDVETTKDLLNFNVIAHTAANLISSSGETPISIGVSGSWGTGKSSLVKMIGAALKEADGAANKYVFLEFNAWLYQGYEDARMALLHSVADKLIAESEARSTCKDKALEFARRINWLSVAKIVSSTASGAMVGGALGGPIGAVIGAMGPILKTGGMPTAEEFETLRSAYYELEPQLEGILREKEPKSLPKEITELRETFKELLKELDITLVVLVDDLDRCLPTTAISTLEAMRLLLFLPRTAFVIAADEEMIRSAVRTHFPVDLSDDLITSYFDKLIQVPLRVPRLGISEVKCYLVLLLAEQSVREGVIDQKSLDEAEKQILSSVRRSWEGGLTKKALEDAFKENANKLVREIELADQLAPLFVSAEQIAGNPRLIKRFLNNLVIRSKIAEVQGLTIGFEQLVKLQLFERCAPPKAFEFLAKHVVESDTGKLQFLTDIEEVLSRGDTPTMPDPCWDAPFILQWLKLDPKLGDTDLRPLLYLSSHKVISLASYDELSLKGRELFDALMEIKDIRTTLEPDLKALGELECENILSRLMRDARINQMNLDTLVRPLNIIKVFPTLGSKYAHFLQEVPPNRRHTALIPHIRDESWAQDLLARWESDGETPQEVKKAIVQLR